jgi:hypothetical protein
MAPRGRPQAREGNRYDLYCQFLSAPKIGYCQIDDLATAHNRLHQVERESPSPSRGSRARHGELCPVDDCIDKNGTVKSAFSECAIDDSNTATMFESRLIMKDGTETHSGITMLRTSPTGVDELDSIIRKSFASGCALPGVSGIEFGKAQEAVVHRSERGMGIDWVSTPVATETILPALLWHPSRWPAPSWRDLQGSSSRPRCMPPNSVSARL